MRNHIPNAITLLNMLSGSIAIVFALSGNLSISGWLIFISAILDFFDGFFARTLKVQSKMGKELDSLADLISFGLAPGMILFVLIHSAFSEAQHQGLLYSILPYVSFLVIICSALRLAKFNTDTRSKEVFYGLPTPANAILIGSLPLIMVQDSLLFGIPLSPFKIVISNPVFLISLTVLLAFLLVSNIRLLSLKFHSFAISESLFQYSFLFASILFIFVFHFAGIPLAIILYFIFSLFYKS